VDMKVDVEKFWQLVLMFPVKGKQGGKLGSDGWTHWEKLVVVGVRIRHYLVLVLVC